MIHLLQKIVEGSYRFIQHHYNKIVIGLTTILLLGFAGIKQNRTTSVFLPGSQPGSINWAESVQICQQCHQTDNVQKPIPIYDSWAGSMMAQSARDPIFYATLAVSNKLYTTSGEYCIRCHSPTGWLAGHSEDFTGQSLAGTDFDGVQCDYCHRAGDPLNPDTSLSTSPNYSVPGYGNGMHAVQKTAYPKRGPLDSLSGPHPTLYDPFQKTSEMCGVCHDVSNPFQAQDRTQQAPYEYGPLERTYSEWALSAFASEGDSGTCQSCHMKDTSGYVCVYSYSYRDQMAKHDLTGGNTFVPDILQDFWTGLDTAALANAKQRATTMLHSAANLQVQSLHVGDSVIATVRITNLTGHKLPTGYPEGRRMWIELIGTGAGGDTVFHSGVYTPDSAQLIHDSQLKVYQIVGGISDSLSATAGIPAGASFHFVLNDTILSDNRIPPKGFSNAAYQSRKANPVAANYTDGQYWDDTKYFLPASTVQVTALLYYQTISKELISYLQTENVGNIYDWNMWGDKLLTSWAAHGKSQPVLMNSVTVPVSVTAVKNPGNTIPKNTELLQNYPNPFNPSTTIEFQLAHAAFAQIVVYNIDGTKVRTLLNEQKSAGIYHIQFRGDNLPSGIYFISFTAGNFHQTKKMLFIK